MAKFTPKKLPFGLKMPEPEDDEGKITPADPENLPHPFKFRPTARRLAGIKEASDAMQSLPDEGESLHCVVTARMDLTDVINLLIARHGLCLCLRVATLGYNARNLAAILEWHDQGLCADTLLMTSKFFRSYSPALWAQTQELFGRRGMACACVYSHAKVITLHFSCGIKYAIEGSANLCGNGSGREQFALIRDPEVHDFHAAWILDMAIRSGSDEAGKESEGEEIHDPI